MDPRVKGIEYQRDTDSKLFTKTSNPYIFMIRAPPMKKPGNMFSIKINIINEARRSGTLAFISAAV